MLSFFLMPNVLARQQLCLCSHYFIATTLEYHWMKEIHKMRMLLSICSPDYTVLCSLKIHFMKSNVTYVKPIMRQGVTVLFSLDFLHSCSPNSNRNHISLLFLSLANIGMNVHLLPIFSKQIFWGNGVWKQSAQSFRKWRVPPSF